MDSQGLSPVTIYCALVRPMRYRSPHHHLGQALGSHGAYFFSHFFGAYITDVEV
jgi:hypothetical protein